MFVLACQMHDFSVLPTPDMRTSPREKCLRQEGFKDVFKRVKDEENAKALQLLPGILG